MYYNTTDDTVYVYDGSLWLDLASGGGGSGDITAVVAGNGLTGGATTGSATLDIAGGTGLTVTSDLIEVDTTVIATKDYVNSFVTQMNWHGAVNYATSAALPNSPTYAAGSADASSGYGIGATLTATTYGALAIDGHTFLQTEEGMRVLVKNQANQVQNGVYDVTEAGGVSTYWVLTRSTDSNNNLDGQVASGDAVFCLSGTNNAFDGFVITSQGSGGPTHVIGTDDIEWYQWTGVMEVTAGSGIVVTGGNTVGIDTGTALTVDGNGLSVQLSSSTSSASEAEAATPLAVSTTYTLADAANSLAVGAIQAAIVGAKGDIISASADDTPAIRSVGSNGQILIADSTETTGLAWLTPPYANSNNAILTGTVKIDNNSSSPQGLGALTSETILQAVSADGQDTTIVLDGHGTSIHGKVVTRSSRGTASSPSATQSGDIIGEFASFGYGATGYGSTPSAVIRSSATENMTDSALGSKLEFLVVPNSSSTLGAAATVTNNAINIPSGSEYKINGTSVLSGSTLGSGITSSSLTSVGTISTGVWQGTTIAIASGGTGQTTAAAAANALLPSQTGLNGRVLQTDGAGNLSWYAIDISNATIDGGSA